MLIVSQPQGQLIMAKEKTDLLQGTLDMLILKALQRGAIHGFGISIEIRRMSQELLKVEQGSLYPALYRLEEQGLIRAEWGVSDNNRKARFYTLTAAGRKQLTVETSNWEQVSLAINHVLGVT
ncbi:MAG: lineage-specific thermal regulator protein [Verrucomicrobia bacterium]|nr:lineage-specific thermal regulator protein [Verrucomicrobiota bacterium]